MNTTWITLITGELGGGKTMREVLWIIERLAMGGPVLSNIQLNREAVDNYVGKGVIDWDLYQHLSLQDVENLTYVLPKAKSMAFPVACSLDEMGVQFSSYDDGTKGHIRRFVDALIHMRKQGIELRLIVQHRDLVQRRIRILCQREIHCFDGRTFRFGPFGFRLFPPYCWMLGCAELDKQGKERRGSRNYILPRKELWGLYESRESYTSLGCGRELGEWKRKKVMTKTQLAMLKSCLALAILSLGLNVWLFVRSGGESEEAPAEAKALVESARPGRPTPAPERKKHGRGWGRDKNGRIFFLREGKIQRLPVRVRESVAINSGVRK